MGTRQTHEYPIHTGNPGSRKPGLFFVSVFHVPIMSAMSGDGVGGDGWIIGTWPRSRGRGRVDYRNIGIHILDLTLRAKCDLIVVVVETETTF